MTTPATRTPVRIARGTYSDLNASVADILDGEICWATDQDKIYVKDGGSLVATMLTSADVGVTVQGYDADTAKTDVAQTFTAAQTFNAAVVFNENQSNVDLRCEGQNASHLAFLDASTNRIGINQGAPAATFDINGNYVSNIVAIGSGTNIDCSLGNYFTINIAANTTLTVSNVPAGRLYSFVLSINHYWWYHYLVYHQLAKRYGTCTADTEVPPVCVLHR